MRLRTILIAGIAGLGAVPGARATQIDARWIAGDGSYLDAPGWSTDPVVPVNGADTFLVTIDNGADVTFGPNAAGVVDRLLVGSNDSLTVTGSSSYGVLDTAVVDGSSLVAADGGLLDLSVAASYTGVVGFNRDRVLTAVGQGSVLDLSGLGSLTRGSGFSTQIAIAAVEGGRVDLRGLPGFTDTAVSNGGLSLAARGADSLLDVSGVTQLEAVSVEGHEGGEVRVAPGFSRLVDSTLTLRGGGVFDHAGVTTFERSAIVLEDGQSEALGAADIDGTSLIARVGFQGTSGSQLSTGATRYTGAVGNGLARSLTAAGAGSVLDLSSLASFTRASGFATTITIEATGGGRVDLGGLTGFTDAAVASGGLTLVARDAGSLLDISGVTGLDDVSVEARAGGEVRVAPGFSSLTDSTLTLRAGGVFDHSGITTFALSGIVLEDGQGETLAAADIDGTSLIARVGQQGTSGSRLTASATSYTGAIGFGLGRTLVAEGAGSVLDLSSLASFTRGSGFATTITVEAVDGGRVDLSGLPGFTDAALDNGDLALAARDAGSVLDISGVTGLERVSVEARSGGEVRVAPGFSSLVDSTLTLRAGGVLDHSGITTFELSGIVLEDGQSEALGAADIDGTSLIARVGFQGSSGSQLSADATSYTGAVGLGRSRSLVAEGAGSVLDLSSLQSFTRASGFATTITVEAVGGGRVDLGGLPGFTDAAVENGDLSLAARDAGSVLDISGATQLADVSVEASAGGEVRVGAGLSSLTDSTLTLRDGGILDHAGIATFERSVIVLEGQSETLGAASIDGTSLIARVGASGSAGSRLVVGATSYTGAIGGGFARTLVAAGAGSVLDLSGLSSFTRGSGFMTDIVIEAADGGLVDLGALPAFTDAPDGGALDLVARDAGSLLDLSSVTRLDAVSVEARSGGEVRVGPGFSSLTGSTLILRDGGLFDHAGVTTFERSVIVLEDGQSETLGATDIDGTSLIARVGAGGTSGSQLSVSATGYVGAVGLAAGRTLAAQGTGSVLDLSSLGHFTRGSGFMSDIAIEASDGGRVDLSGLARFADAAADNGGLSITSDGTGSRVDVSAVAALSGTDVSVDNGAEIVLSSLAAFGSGTFAFDGSGSALDVRVADAFHLGDGGVLDLAGAAGGLVIGDPGAGTVRPGVVNVFAGGVLTGSGDVGGGIDNVAGTVAPGASPGILHVSEDYVQGREGVFAVELGGPLEGEFDVLDVAGTATLDGTIAIELADGYLPDPGDVFDVLFASEIIGVFANGPAIEIGEVVFELQYHRAGALRDFLRLAAVPLPGGLWLLVSALAGLTCWRAPQRATRRRQA